MTKCTLIDQIYTQRDYGIPGIVAIIDHNHHGRLLIADGFGGIDSLDGGAVRFKHGVVVKLNQDDTFAKLNGKWNNYINHYKAILEGYDPDRLVLEWQGWAIANIAKQVGLS
jgi:hypothetical protein